MKNLLTLIAASLLICSCVIEERYVIHEDLSGSYDLKIDVSAFAAEDTSGAMVEGLAHSFDSLATEYEKIDGINNVESYHDDAGVYMAYDWKNLKAVNELEDSDEEIKHSFPMFERTKNGLLIRPYTQDVGETLKKDKEGKEMAEMMDQMLEIRTIIQFDFDVDVKKMKDFQEIGKNTYLYSSKESGLNVTPSLDVRF